MQQLEERLQATTDELEDAQVRVDEQNEVLERAGLGEDRGALSALSQFLDQTEFAGHAAASWNWNFAQPDTDSVQTAGRTPGTTGSPGENTGTNLLSPANNYHRFHNNFQIDQLMFGMYKESTAESRAGFGAEIYFGVSADLQQNGGAAEAFGDNAYLHQGYISYLMENGIQVKAGRFDTIVGYEVFNQAGQPQHHPEPPVEPAAGQPHRSALLRRDGQRPVLGPRHHEQHREHPGGRRQHEDVHGSDRYERRQLADQPELAVRPR